jgi:hypothetical protein
MTSLTSQQEQALTLLKEKQRGRMFIGVTIETMRSDFLSINTDLQTANEERISKLKKSECALFALCGFTP